MTRFLIIPWLLLMLGGCSWFGKSEEQLYLETGESALTVIPDNLDVPNFVDVMPIPEVIDYRGIGDREIELRLPDALSTTFGVEQIVIRTLGEDRWVFLDMPLAIIWPEVVLFWEDKSLPVAQKDPHQGVLETEWLDGISGTPDEIYEALVPEAEPRTDADESHEASASEVAPQPDSLQYRFRVHIEPGVRSGSTELYLEQMERLGTESDAEAASEWDGISDNAELESKMLRVLAYYLRDRLSEGPSVSLAAAGMQESQESKASLIMGPEGTVLKYKLDFNRAWSTVGKALEAAKVSVEDLDRTAAVYYVYYSSGHNPEPGLFRRILGGKDNAEEREAGFRFRVQLESQEEEVLVTVAATVGSSESSESSEIDETENLILRERLLKLIKEHST